MASRALRRVLRGVPYLVLVLVTAPIILMYLNLFMMRSNSINNNWIFFKGMI